MSDNFRNEWLFFHTMRTPSAHHLRARVNTCRPLLPYHTILSPIHSLTLLVYFLPFYSYSKEENIISCFIRVIAITTLEHRNDSLFQIWVTILSPYAHTICATVLTLAHLYYSFITPIIIYYLRFIRELLLFIFYFHFFIKGRKHHSLIASLMHRMAITPLEHRNEWPFQIWVTILSHYARSILHTRVNTYRPLLPYHNILSPIHSRAVIVYFYLSFL